MKDPCGWGVYGFLKNLSQIFLRMPISQQDSPSFHFLITDPKKEFICCLGIYPHMTGAPAIHTQDLMHFWLGKDAHQLSISRKSNKGK